MKQSEYRRAPFWVHCCLVSMLMISVVTASPPAEALVGVVSVDDKLIQNLQRRDGGLLLLPVLLISSSLLLLLPHCSLQHLLQDTTGRQIIK